MWVGCMDAPGPEQLASVGHHSFAVKRPGIFLLAIVRDGALERAGGLGNCALEAKSARGQGFRLKPSDVSEIRL